MTSTVPYIASILFGLAWGSFVGVLVDRIPRGVSAIGGRSHCDSCGRTLGAADLIPVISWSIARGRCRTCGARISARWTVIEIGCGIAAVAAWWASGGEVSVAVGLGAFLGLLIGLTVIDLQHHRLPNAIVYPAAAVATLWIVATAALGGSLSPLGGILGAVAYGGSLFVVSLVSKGGMGMGDVKLAAVIGLMLGSRDLGTVGVAAAAAILLGGLAAIVALTKGADRRAALPFGPMLAAGAFVGALVGQPLADAYLGLFR